MSLYEEVRFVEILAPHLDMFTKTGEFLWNFRCPICGDSQRSKRKARGYIFETKGKLVFKCHNCTASMSFGKFLKFVLPTEYAAYCIECYKGGRKKKSLHREAPTLNFRRLPKRPDLEELQHAVLISDLPDSHECRQFLVKRQIPETCFSRLYFTEDFKAVVKSTMPPDSPKYGAIPEQESRLVIPCYDPSGKLIGLQGRALAGDKKNRYITTKCDDTAPVLVYGLDRWQQKDLTYIVEGPLDSLFLPNAVAAIGSDLTASANVLRDWLGLKLNKTVLVFDNEPRSKELVRLLDKAIDAGFSVCIWPESVKEKDINDMILAGKSIEDVYEIVQTRSFGGLKATLEFSKWKKRTTDSFLQTSR